MAYRSSAPDLPRQDRPSERWDRDRYEYERERERDRYSDMRERYEDDDRYVRRGPRGSIVGGGGGGGGDDRSVARSDSRPRFRDEYDDFVVPRERERRRVAYDDGPPEIIRSRRPSPPPSEVFRPRAMSPPPELERSRVTIEKERYRSPSPTPMRRPTGLLRRQSSLDTFDRKPARKYWEREEYGPPARRDDYRVPPYVDIPLPRSKALPPPRVYAEREHYDEIQVSDPHRYGDDDFHSYPERVREKEIVRTTRRTRSRESRVRRARSRSSSSSSSSSSGGTALTARSEYPKKGKTRIPSRLVSKRALIDLGYPFVEEGNTTIVQKALGQQNIDDLLKLSDDYKKSELEVITARSSAGDLLEERVEHRTEVYEGAAALAVPPPAPVVTGNSGPVIIQANPPPEQAPVEVVKTRVVRDVSPTRYTTTSYDTSTSYDTYDTGTSYDTYTTTSGAPTVVREVSGHMPVGPVALAGGGHHHHYHDPYEAEDLRSEIRHLEQQLARRERSRHRSRHRSASRGDLVRAERLSTGELVLLEEEVEQIQEPRQGGVRIERDKRGPPPRLMKAMLATLT